MKTKLDLLHGNIGRSLIFFAIPLLISNAFQQLYNTVDTIIVGNFLGEVSLAAIGASTPVYEMLVGFALGIGNGMSIVIARKFGAKNEEDMKSSVAGAVLIGIGITIVIMLIAVLLLYPILELLNTPQEVILEAHSYIFTITICIGVMFAYNLAAGLLRSTGNSFIPLIFLMTAAIINIGLDYFFIVHLHMGIRGAAVATVIAKAVAAILTILYIYRNCPELIPQKKHFRIKKELYKELLAQGLSMAFMSSLVFAGSVILQASINGLGYLVIAGHTAARRVNSFCIMVPAAIAVALSTFVSQNRGADQGGRIRSAVRYANLMAVIWSAIATILLVFAGQTMIRIISGSAESVILNNGYRYLYMNAPLYCVLGILFNLRYALQGLGQKVFPLVSSVIELGGKIIFALLVIPRLDYLGVILCEPVIWCFMVSFLAVSFYWNPYIKENAKKRLEIHTETGRDVIN